MGYRDAWITKQIIASGSKPAGEDASGDEEFVEMPQQVFDIPEAERSVSVNEEIV